MHLQDLFKDYFLQLNMITFCDLFGHYSVPDSNKTNLTIFLKCQIS